MADITATLPSSPIVEAVTGQLNPEWRALFIVLMTRTGGNQGVDTGGLQTQINQERSARVAADQVLQNDISGVGAAATTGATNLRAALNTEINARIVADMGLVPRSGPINFFGAAPVAQQAVTGAKGGNAALASLLTALAAYGLIVDSST